ncbi:glutamate--tRNA ligase [Coxiella endosymbiont of Amblyomma sculptum]|nr:glutamate--tRNA ligase [Coxiella endosymbiont of Amblyomma sculptum]
MRTRFAPSPSGYLHIGNARTALFNWLFTKRNRGIFILRIEDTDVQRSTENSVDSILESLRWLKISWERGPYFQSQRTERYREIVQYLLKKEKAYLCSCSKERLAELRITQLRNKKKPRYDGFCRDKEHKYNAETPFVVRFRNPSGGSTIFDDIIRGAISVANDELDDLVIVRADGTPTYNFTVVVDDWDMKITHVIRGDDHANNTPRQINILKALDADLPQYAHVPMILDSDRRRLSKRHGAVSVLQYRDDGYLPNALVNYLVRLGWSYGNQEIFSREEMINLFDINAVNRSPAIFNPKKLLWINHFYLKNQSPSLVEDAFSSILTKMGINHQTGPALEQIISLQSGRTKTLKEMAECSRYFFEDGEVIKSGVQIKKNLCPDIAKPLQLVRDRLAHLHDWKQDIILQTIVEIAKICHLQVSQLSQSIRIAVTGNTASPPIEATLYLIGQDLVLRRLDRVVDLLQISSL